MLFATPPSPVTGTKQDDPELLVTSVGATDATSVLQHVGDRGPVSTNLQQPLQVRRLSSDTDPHIADKSLRQSRTLSNATVTCGSVPGAGVGESAAISVSFHPAGPSFSASNMTVTSADNNSVAAVVAANGGAFGENSGGNGGGGETASVVSSTRTSNLSSFGSLSSSQRGFSRGWNPCDRRVSISSLVAALIALTAIVCATAAFVSVFFLFQGHMGTMLHEFTQETVSDISFVVERHFSQYRSMQVLVDKVVHHADIVTTHVNVTAALTWFARDLYNNNMHMLLVRGLYSGYVIGPYSVFDAVDFPKKENQIVVSVITNSTPSAGQFFDIGYFSLDNFSPINLSQPFTRKTNLAPFNITNRPYYPTISTKIGWSPAYVTVLTKTSAISIGGPWGADVGAPSDSTYSLHDYTQDVVAYFQTLRISKTGVAMLVDVGTSAFVGGNIADGSVVFNVNGTASLVRLDELQDWRVQPTIAAARPHNNNASAPSVLLTCATPCNLVLCSEGLFPLESRPFTLFSEYTLVSVASITDTLGLNMRLIVILPAGDFVSGVRTSATASMVAAAVVIAIVLLIVFVGVHFATKPLRNAAAFLYNTSRLISTSTKPLHLTLSSLQHRDVARDIRSKRGGDRNSGGDYLEQNSCSFCCCCCCFSRVGTGMSRWIPKFAQIEALNNSVHKLASELRTISAFLPNLPPSGVSRHGSMMTNSTSLEDGTTITPQTDAGDDSNQPDTVSSNGSGTPTPPSAAAAAGGNHHHHQLRHAHNRDVSHLTVQSTTHSNSRDVSVSVFAEAHLSSTQISAGQSVGILEKSRHTTLASTPSTINLYSFGTLWRVPVTTVVCNLIGFDTMRKAQQHSELTELHTAYLGVVQAAAKTHGGAVELMHGDRIWVHLNAAKRVVGHAAAACRMMLEIDKTMQQTQLSTYHGVRIGACTGRALCGVMGPPSIRSFTVVGEVIAQALSLCVAVFIGGLEFPYRLQIGQRTSALTQASRDIRARHVRLTFLPHDMATTVVSTPVEISNIRAQYPPSVAPTADIALRRLLYFNTIYDNLAANEMAHAQSLMSATSNVSDEWLLKQLCMVPSAASRPPPLAGGGGAPSLPRE